MERRYMACQGRYMIICDRFVFLHLHKSGGTFVNQLMLKCMPSARRLGYHLPYRELPNEHRHLPVVGTVRNPLAYYVSWFFFQRGQTNPNALFRVCSDNGKLGFAETVRNLVQLHDDDRRIERLIEAFPEHFVDHGLNLTKACIASLGGSGLGFYSFLYDRLYNGALAPSIVPAEALRTAIRPLVLGGDDDERVRITYFLNEAPRLNISTHGPYEDYYDNRLRAMVLDSDRTIIDAYGYS